MRRLSSSLLVVAVVTNLALAGGFGRFGRLHEDGLLTLNVGPDHAATPPQVDGWRLAWRPITQLKVQKLDFTAKTTTGRAASATAPDGWHATLLYPGFGLHFKGAEAAFLLTAHADVRWQIERLPVRPGQTDGILLWSRTRPTAPLSIALPPRRKLLTWSLKGDTLRLVADGPLGEVRVITPVGVRTVNATQPSALRELRLQAAAWARRAIPKWQGRTATVAKNRTTVTFSDRFEVAFGAPWSPVPPVLAFAVSQGYPAQVQKLTRETATETLLGPMAWQSGPMAQWTLPVPDPGEMALVAARSPAKARVDELNLLPEDLLMNWARNAVDLGYSRAVPGLLAWSYLNPDRRTRFDALTQTNFRRVWQMPGDARVVEGTTAWRVAREPFTGESYLWTYAINGEGPWRYDLEWGNALPIYGLAKIAAYRGQTDYARQVWPQAVRADRYMALGQDWAWMTTVNADHGYSTGTGDPMAAAYVGAVAMQRLARIAGDRAAEDRYTVRLASIAVPAVARLAYTPWARKHGLVGSRSVVVGFSEIEGFTRGILGQDPWDVTTLLSGNGALPEFTDWLARTDPDGLDRYLAEYARAYPMWWDAAVKYDFPCTYAGNSGYVVYPHILARRLRGAPVSDLNLWLDGVVGNRMHAWVGTNVIAEVLSHGVPIRLRSWTGAYESGVMDGDEVLLTFRTPANVPRRFEADLDTNRWQVRAIGANVSLGHGERLIAQASPGEGLWSVRLQLTRRP